MVFPRQFTGYKCKKNPCSCKLEMRTPFLNLLVFSYALCSTGALFVHLDKNWNDDLVYNQAIGKKLRLTCTSSSKRIDFYILGIYRKIDNGSRHGEIFPGSNPSVTEVSESYDEFGHAVFERSLLLTVVAELNNTAVQCGGTEYVGNRLIVVYSRGALLRVEDKEISRITGPLPYVDITLVDHGEGGRVDAHIWQAECNSSSDHIAFCVVGAQCDNEYIHGLPNGSNFALSDTLKYYNNKSGRTLYKRNLVLSLVAQPNNILIALQCKAGGGEEAYTRAVLLHAKGLEGCPFPSEGENLCCSGVSPMLNWRMMIALVLTGIFAAWCKL